jgi:hypothetical protein
MSKPTATNSQSQLILPALTVIEHSAAPDNAGLLDFATLATLRGRRVSGGLSAAELRHTLVEDEVWSRRSSPFGASCSSRGRVRLLEGRGHSRANRADGETLVDAWARHLGDIGEIIGGWPIFATLTFKDSVHPETADRAFKFWFKRVESKWFSRRELQRGKGLSYARASERQERGALHFHALIGGHPELASVPVRDLARWWWEQGKPCDFVEEQGDTDESGPWWQGRWHTGIARVERPRSDAAVAEYCSKYATKGQGREIDVIVPAKSRAGLTRMLA